MRRVYGYIRGRSLTGNRAQAAVIRERAIMDYLVDLGRDLIAVDGESGKVPFLERTDAAHLDTMLCREPGAVLIVTSMDRISRDVDDLVLTLDRWAEAGVTLVVTESNQTINLAKPDELQFFRTALVLGFLRRD